jgi:hypothetical protein
VIRFVRVLQLMMVITPVFLTAAFVRETVAIIVSAVGWTMHKIYVSAAADAAAVAIVSLLALLSMLIRLKVPVLMTDHFVTFV